MRLAGKKPTLLCVLVVTWTVSWLLTISLFHIHALDVQEIPLRSNSFLAHTVFSGDLPGEYATPAQQPIASDNQRAVESHYPRYSEIDFVVFEDDDDSTTRKPGSEPQSSDRLKLQQSLLLGTERAGTFEVAVSPLSLSLCSVPSRAPPRIS
jgi:hypothetical protein